MKKEIEHIIKLCEEGIEYNKGYESSYTFDDIKKIAKSLLPKKRKVNMSIVSEICEISPGRYRAKDIKNLLPNFDANGYKYQMLIDALRHLEKQKKARKVKGNGDLSTVGPYWEINWRILI